MEDFSIAASIPLRHTPWTIVILVIAYITVLVVGLVGNVFVVAIVVKTPKMRTVTNYFILNLAIADLLVLIVCLSPSLISNIYVRKFNQIYLKEHAKWNHFAFEPLQHEQLKYFVVRQSCRNEKRDCVQREIKTVTK